MIVVTAFRSILFAALLYVWTLMMAFGYLPLLLLPRRVMVRCARPWIRGVMTLMRVVLGLSFEVRGLENLPSVPVLITSKHQSAFETFAFHLILNDPAFVLKRELQWIPFFGWYLAKTGVIAINRSAGTKALKLMVKGGEEAKAEGRSIIIFPEGTRTPPGTRQPYHTGVAMMYGALKIPVVPVALNSGLFWRKGYFLKRPGVVTIEFLPAIEPGMDRKKFMAEIEIRIESATDQLVAEACARFDLPEPKEA